MSDALIRLTAAAGAATVPAARTARGRYVSSHVSSRTIERSSWARRGVGARRCVCSSRSTARAIDELAVPGRLGQQDVEAAALDRTGDPRARARVEEPDLWLVDDPVRARARAPPRAARASSSARGASGSRESRRPARRAGDRGTGRAPRASAPSSRGRSSAACRPGSASCASIASAAASGSVRRRRCIARDRRRAALASVSRRRSIASSASSAIRLPTSARDTASPAPATSANRRAADGPRAASREERRSDGARDAVPEPRDRRVQMVTVPREELVRALPAERDRDMLAREPAEGEKADRREIRERLVHVPDELVDRAAPARSISSS